MGLRSKSAIKRVRSSAKRHARNLAAKTEIKKSIKSASRAIASKSSDVQALITKVFSVVDKAVARGIVHRNKAARQKSRLSKKARGAQA